MVMNTIIAVIIGYLLGSIPFAYIAGRMKKGIDIREVGSHNLGAMNVFYRVGFVPGLLVLAADIAKGAAAVALARYIAVPVLGVPLHIYAQLLAGIVVIAGHAFPVFLKFHGGKGGAACIGVLAFVMPWGIPFYIAIFGIMMGITRYPTLSYSAAFLCFPFLGWLKYHSALFIVFSIVLLLLPVIKYIPRIKEMKTRGGSWSRVLKRKDIKDRL